MKKHKTKIPDSVIAECDFAYVKQLPKSMHQLVCYYEYWRESNTHRELIQFCRAQRIFTPEREKSSLTNEQLLRLMDLADIYPFSVVKRLTECPAFPEKPFKESGISSDTECAAARVPAVSESSWRLLLSIRENWKDRDDEFLKFLEGPYRDQHLIPIAFHWSYTNKELTAAFQELLKRIRPPQFPEPKKAGRSGRSSGSGALDKLNQLAAFRLVRSGFSFEDGGNKTLYASEKGWAKAVRVAKERIARIATHTLFGDEEVVRGIKFGTF